MNFKSVYKGGRKQSQIVDGTSGSGQEQAASADAMLPDLRPQPEREESSPSSRSPPPTLPFPDGCEVLHDSPDAAVDICFVHGLTGNRDSTWIAYGSSAPWPKTLLPPKLSKARILTYGYDAYIVRKSVASSNRLIDHATNLLNDFDCRQSLLQCVLASTYLRPLTKTWFEWTQGTDRLSPGFLAVTCS